MKKTSPFICLWWLAASSLCSLCCYLLLPSTLRSAAAAPALYKAVYLRRARAPCQGRAAAKAHNEQPERCPSLCMLAAKGFLASDTARLQPTPRNGEDTAEGLWCGGVSPSAVRAGEVTLTIHGLV